MKQKLEIACFNLESALIAQEGGADRVELCKDISIGGITPDESVVKEAREKIKIALVVMINPEGKEYIYSDMDFGKMKKSIVDFKAMGVDGLVFGILNKEGTINKEQNKELVQLAFPLPCTFHRAFDKVKNPLDALEDIINCGFKTILTSGQKQTAIAGIDLLIDLVSKANGRIAIMPGGGVRSTHISVLKEKLDTSFFHSSAITASTEFADVEEVKSLKAKLS